MSKALVDREDFAHELWSAAQLVPGEGISDGVARIAALLAQTEQAPMREAHHYWRFDLLTGRLVCITPAEYEAWGKDNQPCDAYLPAFVGGLPTRPAQTEQKPVAYMALNSSGFPEKCLPADPNGFPVYAAPIAQTEQEPYPHDHPLHKAVFMARESYTGSETFEDGVRGLIAELQEARAALRAQPSGVALPGEFTKGDTDKSGEDGKYEAGIHHLTPDATEWEIGGKTFRASLKPETWFQRIVVYGNSADQANALRDRVLARINQPAELAQSGLEEALRELLGCPYVIEESTVPKAGIDAAPPYQVVGTLHVSLTRLRKARAALATQGDKP